MVRLAEGPPEAGVVEIPAISWRSGSLSPGVVEITRIDRIEAEIVHEAKHRRSGVRRIARNRQSYPLRLNASLRSAMSLGGDGRARHLTRCAPHPSCVQRMSDLSNGSSLD